MKRLQKYSKQDLRSDDNEISLSNQGRNIRNLISWFGPQPASSRVVFYVPVSSPSFSHGLSNVEVI